MEYKVGDRVKVIKEGTHGEAIGALVTIVAVREASKAQPYKCQTEKRGNWWFYENEIEPVLFTKSDLKDGDMVTFRNGTKAIKVCGALVGKDGVLRYVNSYEEDLTRGDQYCKDTDIVKVERPPENLNTVFERKEEILNEAEKEYLSGVIRPFRDVARFIEKEDNGKISRIKICFDYHFMYFPILEKEKRMYEGMEANRSYSIKELGL